jgi:nitroimidazol reductase NimA-like FMN-containing flavoprotein (pyridoxamine 5'-phosphate oxidase superfamily)
MSELNRQAELAPDDCLQLLASQEVGRLVLGHTDPNVRPVNFVVSGGRIFIRTDTPLPRDAEVVFEVDQIDSSARVGWSVIARGHAQPVDVDLVPASVRERLSPWAPASKPAWTAISVESITGRWVCAERPADALDNRGYL